MKITVIGKTLPELQNHLALCALRQVLPKCKGNKRMAAQVLGINRNTVATYFKQLNHVEQRKFNRMLSIYRSSFSNKRT